MDQQLNDDITSALKILDSDEESLTLRKDQAISTGKTFDRECAEYKESLQKQLDFLDNIKANIVKNFRMKTMGEQMRRSDDIAVYKDKVKELEERETKLEEALKSEDDGQAIKVLEEERQHSRLLHNPFPFRAYESVTDLAVIPHSGKVVTVHQLIIKSSTKTQYFEDLYFIFDRLCSIKRNEDGTYFFIIADKAFKCTHIQDALECKDGRLMIVAQDTNLTITLDQIPGEDFEVHENDNDRITPFESQEEAILFIFSILPYRMFHFT